jgi:hypothetical protein
MDIIQERAILRFKYLECVYNSTNGNRFSSVDMNDVAKVIGIPLDVVDQVVTYLRDENLIENRTRTQISVTHSGILEIEQAHLKPDEPTQHFPAGNVINIGTMTNSAIQQGSNGATQTFALDESKVPDILSIVELVKSSISELNLEKTKENDMQAELDTISAQLKSSVPKKSILKESLHTVRNILEGAAGSMVAQAIITQIVPLLATL